jgi:hypothetical protein
MATSFSGGGSQSTQREPPTLGKQLVGLVASFAYLTPPIKVSILSFENGVLFAEEFFVDISRISL